MGLNQSRKKTRLTVAVVTGTRADFGLLVPVMRAIDEHAKLELKVVAAGWHFVAKTMGDIKAAGFGIDAKVKMQKAGEVGMAADAAALGRGVSGFARVFEEMQPDVVVVLGDRIEAFAAASAAAVGGIKVAHIHGGDRAEGVADESMRHAISKLAHVHFAATAGSRKRLIRMGESVEAVFNVGSPAVDGLKDVEPVVGANPMIVMQHPVGASDEVEYKRMMGTLKAVKKFDPFVMAPNGDAGRDGILRAIDEMEMFAFVNQPRDMWLENLAGVGLGGGVLVGNSSAGLIEAAVLKVGVVNIGSRQNGREKPGNVVDCAYGEKAVRAAVKEAMAMDTRRVRHPYGAGCSGVTIAEILGSGVVSEVSMRKKNSY